MATALEEPRRKEKAPAPVVPCGRSVTVADERMEVSVPPWVVDLDSFRRWAESDDVPETLRVWYLKGEVWIDMGKQQIFSHLALKNVFNMVLGGLVQAEGMGLYLPDGLFLANFAGDVGGNPDATFISNAALDSNRVRLIEGKKGGYVEVEGSPDMVLEIVSDSSVRKDDVVLRQGYWEGAIREYWLVDARKEPLRFDILRHSVQGYKPARKLDGWIKSAVFGKAFRLTHQLNKRGLPEFTLEVR
jgi:Uma2 family endonuclease